MFKKEAEEYLTKLLKRLKIKKEDLAENQPEIQSWEKMNFVSLNVSNVSKAFQKGAEFGYNKAKEDADIMKSRFLELCNLKDMRIEELEKANEYAKTIVKDLLNNSDEYARERAINFLEVN